MAATIPVVTTATPQTTTATAGANYTNASAEGAALNVTNTAIAKVKTKALFFMTTSFILREF